jgi:hypothetical protein
MTPDQPDLFDQPDQRAVPRRERSALIVAFPLERHASVRVMAERMLVVAPQDRDLFWRTHTAGLVRDRRRAGLTRDAARADVAAYTRAVRRIFRFLEAGGGRPASGGSR